MVRSAAVRGSAFGSDRIDSARCRRMIGLASRCVPYNSLVLTREVTENQKFARAGPARAPSSHTH